MPTKPRANTAPSRESLAKAAALAPPAPVGVWASKLRAAAYDAVTEADFASMFKAAATKAKGGDLKALQFLAEYLTPAEPTPPPVNLNFHGANGHADHAGPRLVPADPPPPDVTAWRRLVALHIHVHGATEVHALQSMLGLSDVEAVIDCEWFSRTGREVGLTPAGRAAVA